MSILVIGAVLVLVFLLRAESAGFTSHNTAARRASQYELFGPNFNPDDFAGLAAARPDAIQGGAPFPDYLYVCGDDHDAGEVAHWTPFQIAAATYIRATYPNWAAEDRLGPGPGLVAFFFGVTSHYIADINWHGLETVPAGEGLIRSMGYADFNCTNGDLCSAAHSAADTGGEFAAAGALNLTWYPGAWYLPIEDLVEIYAMVGKSVESEWIKECGVLFYVGSVATSKLGDLVYNLFIAKRVGATLYESYLDFFIGGIDDDAAWTAVMWNRFAEWVAIGPPDDPPNSNDPILPLSVSMQQILRRRRLSQRSYLSRLRTVLHKYRVFPLEIDGDGLFRLSTAKESGWKIEFNINLSKSADLLKHDEALLFDISNALLDEYIVDTFIPSDKGDFDDIENLRSAIHRRIHDLFFPQNEKKKSPSEIDPALLFNNLTAQAYGSQPHEYMGSSITVGAFSSNKVECDALIGSYGAGVPGSAQRGDAKIYFGGACTNVYDQKNTFRFRSSGINDSHNFNFPTYERFAWSSAAIDVNRDGWMDAVLCAPSFGGINVSAVVGNYSGRCDIFYGPFSPNSEDVTISVIPAVSIFGDRDFGQFGENVIANDLDNDGFIDLIVSATSAGSYEDLSTNDMKDTSSQGAVYVYLGKSLNKKIESAVQNGDYLSFSSRALADIVLQRPESFQLFGKSLHVAQAQKETLLFIGAPTFHSMVVGDENSAVGRLYAYSMASSTSYYFSITGCHHAGRTASAIAFSRNLQVIAFSEPAYNASKLLDGRNILRSGRVIIVPLQSILNYIDTKNQIDFNVCDLVQWDEVIVIEGDSFEGRFGSSLLFRQQHGSSDHSSETDVLFVSSPLADAGAGHVHAYKLMKTNPKTKLLLKVSGSDLGESKGRLGSSLALADAGNVLLTGVPLADNGGVAPDGDQVGMWAILKPLKEKYY